MTNNQLLEYIKCGREIEFIYNSKKYSITYGVIDGKNVISFCEFNKESTEVEHPEELLAIARDGKTVQEMLNSTSSEDIWIY